MAVRAITRADLSEAVYQEVGLSRRESAELAGSAGARGEAEAITRKSDIADGMSEAGGIPDLPWASPEGPFIAISGSQASWFQHPGNSPKLLLLPHSS